MKIKFCLISAILCAMCFFGIGSASALEVQWDNLANRFKTLVESAGADGYTIDVNPGGQKEIQVSLTNPVYKGYFIKFTYDEGQKKITYTYDPKNRQNRSDQNLIYCRYTDDYFVTAMFYAILDQYKVGDNQGVSTSNWSEYGVTVTEGKDLNYGKYHEKEYASVVFDLNTFNTKTQGKQSTLSGDPYKTKLMDLKKYKDPMGDCLEKFGNPDNPNDPNNPNVATNKNPKTGLNLPIAGGVIVLAGLGLAYVVIRKKNLFANM